MGTPYSAPCTKRRVTLRGIKTRMTWRSETIFWSTKRRVTLRGIKTGPVRRSAEPPELYEEAGDPERD